MIRLLFYHFSLHARMISTYVMLTFVAIAFWLIAVPTNNEALGISAIAYSSLIIVWITLTFILQLTAMHHFFFRPEALQYRLARLRNRSMVLAASHIHIVILAILASFPFAIIYFGMLDDAQIAMLSWLNMVVFYVFLGMATSLIIHSLGSNALTGILVLVLLFLAPLSFSGLNAMAPSLANHPIGATILAVTQSHLDVSSNPEKLILRGIQDSNALLRTLIITPILASITYVLFLRKDHH